jgi:PiT family inorganic phosphate transporter
VTAASPFAVVAAASWPRRLGILLFTATLLAGALYAGSRLLGDLAHAAPPTLLPYLLLGVALLIALGFEFVNGFHDTANAVATVIYTHSLPPHVAVIWSGVWNFLGVLHLHRRRRLRHPVAAAGRADPAGRLGAGFAMVFALLIAAIIWNLGTWYLGLPASSSHTLIGSIIGVGLANQLMAPAGTATSGVDWRQARASGMSLLLSPIVGFSPPRSCCWS